MEKQASSLNIPEQARQRLNIECLSISIDPSVLQKRNDQKRKIPCMGQGIFPPIKK